MEPYIFPECKGCENHRYTYANRFINVITGTGADGREIIHRVDVEPETHYCSTTLTIYHKLNPSHRPYGCTRPPKSTQQEVINLNEELANIPIAQRDIHIVTAEILTITENTRLMVLNSAIEIGRRLCEAKEMLPHGAWGSWLKDSVNFGQSTATNLMRVFKEYGESQASLFGAAANSQTFGNLSYGQAVALFAVPVEEREDFIKDNAVEDISVRQLKELLKERDRQVDILTTEKQTAQQALKTAQGAKQEKQERIKTLESQLSEARKVQQAAPEPADTSELEAKLTEANNRADKLAKALAKEKDRPLASADTATLEGKLSAAQEHAAMLERKLKAMSNQETVAFGLLFKAFQNTFNDMEELIEALRQKPDTETADKLYGAVQGVLKQMSGT